MPKFALLHPKMLFKLNEISAHLDQYFLIMAIFLKRNKLSSIYLHLPVLTVFLKRKLKKAECVGWFIRNVRGSRGM